MNIEFGIGTATFHKFLQDSNSLPMFLSSLELDKIRYIDTAPIYAHGKAEFLLGKHLREKENLRIISKVGLKYTFSTNLGFKIPKGKGLYFQAFPEKIEKTHIKKFKHSIKNSLKNLKLDSLHGLLVHSFVESPTSEDQLSALFELKQQGIVEKIGISVDSELTVPPKGLDIIEAPVSLLTDQLLRNHQGKLIVNSILKTNIQTLEWKKFAELNIEEIILLCGSTKPERVNNFINYWGRDFISTGYSKKNG